jgi:hypothetical protein
VNVDWELLADHLGGALAGTPEGARVERLVSTDPGWARAATDLSTAMDAVAADLRTLPAPAMPDDVMARLETAFAAAAAVSDVGSAGAPSSGGRSAGEARRPPTHPANRKRRRVARWSAGLAVAAGVAAFAAVGISGWEPDQSRPGLTTDSGGEADGDAAPEALDDEETARGLDPLPPLVVATGSDYDATTLEITEPTRPTPVLGGPNLPSPPQQAPDNNIGPNDASDVVPEPLLRLWTNPEERLECLSMIAESIQPPRVTINTVDFAAYEGQPALVIWATAGDGSRWAWVSGPTCGSIAGDPDVRFQTQLS